MFVCEDSDVAAGTLRLKKSCTATSSAVSVFSALIIRRECRNKTIKPRGNVGRRIAGENTTGAFRGQAEVDE